MFALNFACLEFLQMGLLLKDLERNPGYNARRG